MAAPLIRAATSSDHAQIAKICLATGLRGADATGAFGDDTALSDVYATPYLTGDSGFCLVWDVDGEARGYVLGASDTVVFQRWFSQVWWPVVGPQHSKRTPNDEWLLDSAADPKRMLNQAVDHYPAHLHIDLLPDQQRKGAGALLIEAACAFLAEQAVPGVHLVAERANSSAVAFYPKVGFGIVAEDDATLTFARCLP